MHLHKAFRAEFVTSLLIAAFGRAQLSVSPLPPTETVAARSGERVAVHREHLPPRLTSRKTAPCTPAT